MLTTPTIILTLGIYAVSARWVSFAVSSGAWRTTAIVVAGLPLAVLWGLAAAMLVSYFAQSMSGHNASAYMFLGLKNGGMCMMLHPFIIWAYRRQRQTAPTARPIG